MCRLAIPLSPTLRRAVPVLGAAVILFAAGCSTNTSASATTTPSTDTSAQADATSATTVPETTTSTVAESTTTTPSTATTTAPPASDTAAELQAVTEAAEMFVPAAEAARGVAGGSPNPNHPDLQRWLADPVLGIFEQSLTSTALLGQTYVGTSPYRLLDSPSPDGDLYRVDLCLFGTTQLLDRDGNEVLGAGTEPDLFELVLTETEAGWATSEFIRIEGVACEV